MILGFSSNPLCITDRCISEDQITDRLSSAIVQSETIDEYGNCLKNPTAIIPHNLTLSVVLTENYARPLWRQQIEIFLSKLTLIVDGHLPDFSMGSAQIRPSSASRVLLRYRQYRVNNNEMIDLLSDRCSNLQIAELYLQFITENNHITTFSQANVERIAQEYNGQIDKEAQQNRFYRIIVWKIFQSLSKAR